MLPTSKAPLELLVPLALEKVLWILFWLDFCSFVILFASLMAGGCSPDPGVVFQPEHHVSCEPQGEESVMYFVAA